MAYSHLPPIDSLVQFHRPYDMCFVIWDVSKQSQKICRLALFLLQLCLLRCTYLQKAWPGDPCPCCANHRCFHTFVLQGVLCGGVARVSRRAIVDINHDCCRRAWLVEADWPSWSLVSSVFIFHFSVIELPVDRSKNCHFVPRSKNIENSYSLHPIKFDPETSKC